MHRTLLYGGVFGYPGDSKGAPDGKLRLIHEVAPMAFLVEQVPLKYCDPTFDCVCVLMMYVWCPRLAAGPRRARVASWR